MHLGAMYPGTNSTTTWSDPDCGSYTDFASFVHLARSAESARFDLVFLAETLRMREQGGKVYDRDVAGRPDNFTILSALAAVTDRIGLVGTANSTFHEPYELARKFATLDHLSAGRAGWNVVTSWDAYVGENFRRGGYLKESQRYERAESALTATLKLLDSWQDTDVVADRSTGRFVDSPTAGAFDHHDSQFDISGRFNVPRSPQGRPVIFQAGTSEAGREFAAAAADAIFGMYNTVDEKKAFSADIRARLVRHGRTEKDLRYLPATTFALGDTDDEAWEHARSVRRRQVDGRTALTYLEEVWNRDLSWCDPDGPLPTVDPVEKGDASFADALMSVRRYPDRMGTARRWRELAEAKGLSIRDLIIEVTGWQTFVGSPTTVADQMTALVDEGACDGFMIVPNLVPHGLDEFARTVVPLLQERGALRADYDGATLRDHLGLRPC
jgi:FMN-dependent oxidoreductase (nitrilotriacetate monooxygenase family)